MVELLKIISLNFSDILKAIYKTVKKNISFIRGELKKTKS